MKLLDSSEVCDLLGISKSTLYRWCGVSEDPFVSNASIDPLKSGLFQFNSQTAFHKPLERSETPTNFPKPFQIGRAYKWKDEEIMAWLETRRV